MAGWVRLRTSLRIRERPRPRELRRARARAVPQEPHAEFDAALGARVTTRLDFGYAKAHAAPALDARLLRYLSGAFLEVRANVPSLRGTFPL